MFGIFEDKKNNEIVKDIYTKEDITIVSDISSNILSKLQLDEVLQQSVDDIVSRYNFLGGLLFLVQGEYLYAKTISGGRTAEQFLKLIGKPVSDLRIKLDKSLDNYVVNSVIDKDEKFSFDLYNFTKFVFSENLTNVAGSLTRTKACISIPILYRNEALGALFFSKSTGSNFDQELPILRLMSNQIGIAIVNANLFEEANQKLNLLELKNEDLQSLYNLTSRISTSLDPAEVAQTSVNSLPQDKFIIGAVLNSYDKGETETLAIKALTQSTLSYEVMKLIGDPQKYTLKMDHEGAEFNMAVKAVRQNIAQYSNELKDYLAPTIPGPLISAIENILQIKSVASYPLIIRGNIIGVITYFIKEKTVEELTEGEKQLLGTYTYHITISLENAELYKQQQETQANLENALMEVQALRQHEQDMIDIMGHELRTPISIVRNALGMLELELKNTGEIKKENLAKFLDISMESARREVKLVETLLSSAKADSRGFQLLFEKVDFLDVINDSLEFFTREAEKKGLQIKYTKPNEEFWIYADRTRIQEVMDNLLSNAVKYTDKGFIKINVRKDGEFAWVDVTDTGIGMDEKDLKSIGQKFYRVDQYMDKEETVNEKPNIIRPGGTGLGLYVTFSLVKVMDGKVEVKSQLGVGTTFSYSMPLYKGQESKQEQRKP